MSIEQTLDAYGEQIGVSGLRFDAGGAATLKTASGRLLAVERGDEEVLVYIAQPLGYDAAAMLQQAFKAAHFSCHGDTPVQVAARDERGERSLIGLVRIAERDLTVLRLQQTVEHLSRWFTTLQDA
jgi:type III secretion system chaperone SycN